MFSLAILIGIYSYLIFAIGLLGLLYKQTLLLLTIAYIFVFIISFKERIIKLFGNLKLLPVNIRKYKLESFLISLLVTQALVNLVGALGPELGFDALWYHLILPKIYLLNHSIIHIPGGLLYYSDMPKLTEMLYTASLALGNEILAKLVHFSFGILTCVALYFLSRKFLNNKLSIAVVAIFYSNLVVGWQSITAYVDLARAFFEVMALWGFINFLGSKDTPYQPRIGSILGKIVREKWLIQSAVMLGLAISTKLLAVGSIPIFTALMSYFLIKTMKKTSLIITNILVYWCIAILVSLPWLVFSLVHTGNPVYPLFSSFFQNINQQVFNVSLLNPINFIKASWGVLTQASDPISPAYIIFLPIVISEFKKLNFHSKIITLYCFLGFIFWYFTSRVEGARLLVPYLPVMSLASVISFNNFIRNDSKRPLFEKIGLVVVIITVFISVAYRGIANYKYLPVILGIESKNAFLSKNLNFSFGDFYDTDGYLSSHIRNTDKVLLYGFHNLYYVDFPFIDSSWVKKGDTFNYIAVQNSDLPKRFSNWNLIYYNPKTHVRLYSLGGIKWAY